MSNSVYRKLTKGWSTSLAHPFKDWSADPPATWYSDEYAKDYYKQFGLGVYVLAAASPRDVDAMGRFLLSARYAAAALAVGVASLIIALISRSCGALSGALLLAFVAADWRYGTFLHSLFWLPGVGLLPLAVVLGLYAPNSTPRRFRVVLLIFAAAVCLRALCGYEHISAPVLGACAGVVFRGRPASWRLLVRHAGWFVAAGSVGVAAALAIHFASLYVAFGSVDEAVRNTIGNAVNRSVGSHEAIAGANTVRSQLFGIYNILAQNKLLTVLLAVWAMAIAFWTLRRRWLEARGPNINTLGVASGLAFIAACSWLVLMRVHVAIAPQFNSLVFFLGFVWFAVPFVEAVACAVAAPRNVPAKGN
jgi:hypothetical protein